MTKKILLVTLTCLFLFAFAGSALAVDTCNICTCDNCISNTYDSCCDLCIPCNPCGFTYTPGYWKNHTEVWPADTAIAPYGHAFIGFSQAEWLDILNTPPKGDAKLIFAHAWIAACLNYLNGSYTGPGGEVTYITDGQGLALFNGASRDALIEAAAFLDGYNNSNEPL